MHFVGFHVIPSLLFTISFTSYTSASPVPEPVPNTDPVFIDYLACNRGVYCCEKMGPNLIEPAHTDGFVYAYNCFGIPRPAENILAPQACLHPASGDGPGFVACCDPDMTQWNGQRPYDPLTFTRCNPINVFYDDKPDNK